MDLLLTHGYFLAEDAQERRVMKPYPPLGILYIGSHLKARGFEVEVFDTTFRSFADFLDRLERDRPGVVGIYCNLMTKRNVLRMIAECRRVGALVVLGGPEPPHYAEQYLERGADVVVVGEGELTLEQLVPRLLARPGSRDLGDVDGVVYRDEHGRLVRTPPRALIPKLDAQPPPDREAIDMRPYLEAWRSRHGMGSVSLLTARGCPYTCRWCSRSVFGETHRRRSPAKVADEVRWIVERYAPDMLWYVDDVFTIHHGWMREYLAEMSRRGLRVPFECISRADRLSEEVADALARLGCFRLWIGSESGSQRILDAMDRRVSVEQVQRASGLLRSRGIQVGMFIMLGYTGEQQEDLEATVDHLKKAAPDVFLTTVAYPIKGTPYYEEVAGRISRNGDWATTSDRDFALRGRHTRRYYEFARRWMVGEVARERHWKRGSYLRAARAAAMAGVGRIGMALLERRTEC
jgi:radical SAM superfamily enzyme YgiQ (UPF0313 family)